MDELQLRITNLIQGRLDLQKFYREFSNSSQRPVLPKEDKFIKEVREIILNNLENENFNSNDICEIILISRSGLHNKIKGLTGLSTSNYINLVRLQKAKELLETTNLNVNEISFKVGFTMREYFSKLFKKEYGSSPKQFRVQQNKEIDE